MQSDQRSAQRWVLNVRPIHCRAHQFDRKDRLFQIEDTLGEAVGPRCRFAVVGDPWRQDGHGLTYSTAPAAIKVVCDGSSVDDEHGPGVMAVLWVAVVLDLGMEYLGDLRDAWRTPSLDTTPGREYFGHINNVQDDLPMLGGDWGMDQTHPVNLDQALASFDDVWSPRIVATMNDYDVRIAHTLGEHMWHAHTDTDEFFLVLDGVFDIALRDAAGVETTVHLTKGDTYVVPKGTEHKPSSPGGSILMFEPAGTLTTGDDDQAVVPDHVDSTSGHQL